MRIIAAGLCLRSELSHKGRIYGEDKRDTYAEAQTVGTFHFVENVEGHSRDTTESQKKEKGKSATPEPASQERTTRTDFKPTCQQTTSRTGFGNAMPSNRPHRRRGRPTRDKLTQCGQSGTWEPRCHHQGQPHSTGHPDKGSHRTRRTGCHHGLTIRTTNSHKIGITGTFSIPQGRDRA